MKKTLILGMVLAIMSVHCIQSVIANPDDAGTIKGAISKYKDKNYVGCISDLKLYVDDDPSSAIAWYYLGSSYMNIAMKTEAHQAFDKVIMLNSVPQLTSYSIQAKLCMENKAKCNYQNFSFEEIQKLKEDPSGFLDKYFASLVEPTKSENEIEIDKLINGYYSNNIHPAARDFILQERAKIKQSEMNVANSANMTAQKSEGTENSSDTKNSKKKTKNR